MNSLRIPFTVLVVLGCAWSILSHPLKGGLSNAVGHTLYEFFNKAFMGEVSFIYGFQLIHKEKSHKYDEETLENISCRAKK